MFHGAPQTHPGGSPHTRRTGPLTRPWLALAAVWAVAACDDLPLDPGALDAPEVQAAVQEVWADLPSTLYLELEAVSALDGSSVEGEAATALLDAAELATEAELALAGSPDAIGLAEAADTLATKGLLGTLGGDAAVDVVARVERALATLSTEFEGRADLEVRTRMSEGAAALARARAALDSGDAAGGLLHAGRASEAVRWLDPEAKARATLAAAETLLARARLWAGDTPEAPIGRALGAAEVLCGNAARAVDAGRWRIAVQEGLRCARIARAVLIRLSAGVDPEVLAQRAEEAVAHAAAVLERATEAAGPTPDARLSALLTEAEGLLGRARVALDEGRFRAAIGLAIESSARSHRVLRLLRVGDGSPYEWRATAAVEVARALSARVELGVGIDPPAVLADARAAADALLTEAEAAFEEGRYRLAWGLARRSITLYTRILVAIA